MTTITTHYGITSSVPFVDVELESDNYLFVDPQAIRLSEPRQRFAAYAIRCMDTFADEITACVLSPDAERRLKGEELLQRFTEPWETRLGMSRNGFRGHGGSTGVGALIWEALNKDLDALIRIGSVSKLEELPLFVRGIDRDIASDITTRLVFGALADFTAAMIAQYPQFTSGERHTCSMHKQVWDADRCCWRRVDVQLPMAGDSPVLLVPREWARLSLLMNAERYHSTEVLSFVQLEQADFSTTGKLITTPKRELRKQRQLRDRRSTNLAVTLRAYENGEDLLRSFKRFVFAKLEPVGIISPVNSLRCAKGR